MENQKFSRKKTLNRFRREFQPGWRAVTGLWLLPRLGKKYLLLTIKTTWTDLFPRDGFALSTLYRKVQDLDCPILMVIQVLFK